MRWLGRLFAPHNVDQTLDVLTAAQDVTPPEAQALAMARRQIAECDRKLDPEGQDLREHRTATDLPPVKTESPGHVYP
ncbi:hypothetical protein [Nonomuraea angiospora]|uniref:hypothetical protein n=1 Tax=Nonomuraea angiospora TaxID=46172 RepID=UPI0029B305AC|nr:hypothetical protein [Nonomuraea angiospora]MDX3105522.1 hypothetical protein [Nonomuraea angiospora]